MERDFLGLNYKDPIVIEKECVDGSFENSELINLSEGFEKKSSGAAWPWLNKPSHFTSSKNDQDEKFLKLKSDLLASHAYMAKPGSDMFEAMHKRQSGDIIQNEPLAAPIRDVSMMSSFMKPYFPNFGGANNNNVKQEFLGGFFAPPISPPSAEQWKKNNNNSKSPSGPTQLTIFYGGTVNVFDDITPEKAQAIIFLAGNGCVSSSNMTPSKLQIPPPLPGAMSDSCFTIDHSGNNDDVMALFKTAGMSTSKVEPLPRMILPIRSVASFDTMPSAVPQARKASLARFLKKRKERATNAAPYNLNKNGADDTTQGLNDFGFSASSGV